MKMRSFLLLCVVTICAISVSAQHGKDKKKQPPPPPSAGYGSLSLRASDWGTLSTPQRYAVGNDATGALTFPFLAPPSSMGYLYRGPLSKTIAGQFEVSMRVSVTGSSVVVKTPEAGNTCDSPATARLFFWAHGQSWADYDRWWSNPIASPLVDGTFAMSVQIQPNLWSSVNGRFGNDPVAQAGWASAVTNVTGVGLTFGGGCFFGHGASLEGQGSATFALLSFAVKPS